MTSTSSSRAPPRRRRTSSGYGRCCSAQRDEAGRRRAEPARPEIEVAQLLLEVDVEPFAAGLPALAFGHRQQPAADADPPPGSLDERVDDEGMGAAVPGHVEEADQAAAVGGADPAQTVPLDLRPPIDVEHGVHEALGMQRVDVAVCEGGRHP